MPKSNNSIPAFAVIAILALAFGAFFQHFNRAGNTLPELEKTIILPNSKSIQGIDFTDHNGQKFTKESLLGRWSILFFGFTNCPDICPTTMHMLKQVKSQLVSDQAWGNYQVIMVSVDPQRDTPKQLSNYVPYFDSEFIGVSGSLETTTNFAKQLGILFYATEADEAGNYDVDHGTALILINPMGEMAGVIAAPHQSEVIARDLAKLNHYYALDHASPSFSAPTKPSNAQKAQSLTAIDPGKIENLHIENEWIRPAPPGTVNLAGYFDLVNSSEADISLTQVESPVFDNTMIHQTVIEDGIAQMEHLDSLLIPAKSKVSLKPMGTHLMLMGAERDLAIGQSVSILLSDDSGTSYQFELPVREKPIKDSQQQ